MSKYTINITQSKKSPSVIIENNLTEDSCSSTKEITIIIPSNSSKYITIVQSGIGTNYIGLTGTITSNTNYTLIINGDNTNGGILSGTIVVTARDKKGGEIEDQLIFTRQHEGTLCSGGPS